MDLKLPHLGEGADSGTVVNLFVKEGDRLSKGQAVLELENEKAVATIPSTLEGIISRIYVQAGEKVSVGQKILSVGAPATEASLRAPVPVREEKPPLQSPAPEPAPVEPPAEAEPGASSHPPSAAPSIRKLARDLGIDLTRIRGSQRGGRIVLEDVRAYIQRLQRIAAGPRPAASTGPAAAQPAPQPVDFSKWGPVSKNPFSSLRQVIARRMSENWMTIPHVTQFDEANITALMALRKKHAPAFEQKGARLTLTSFALKAVIAVLKKHPVFNSSLDEASQQLISKEYYHIGLAVDTEAGLIVPVIRDVDKKSLLELSLELQDLAARTRDRRVSSEELKGGTFTISNQGGIGGGHFTPIINKPEVAILGLGRASQKPVVADTGVVNALVLPLALSYDHRVIDGGQAARFIVDLVAAFEDFNEEELRL
jgi:pyruvate dehydrogenase E2 component (dihydrolipoamide acetyltransferase)